ncbi:MAG: sugar-transfer associated ATP-grasp domain-containing protein [Nannocystaceae bacterium]
MSAAASPRRWGGRLRGRLRGWLDARRRIAPIYGINRRNVELVYAHNPRRHYPLVDDKILCKERLAAAGVPLAPTIAICRGLFEVDATVRALAGRDNFVIKPASGSGGDGIIVLGAREGGAWRTPKGRPVDADAIRQHLANITFGTFAKNLEDRALIEARIEPHALYDALWPDGVCDLRIIVLDGRPLLAMVRVPTRRSGGRANLHQGGIGVAVDIDRGETYRAVSKGRAIATHPESGERLVGRRLPLWGRCVEVALAAAAIVPLGYLGVDLCVDRRWGPVIIELNARPGLEIQNVCARTLGDAL